MIRRKRLPEELVPAFEAFQRVLDEVEPAKAALTDVIPGSRLPGRPLDDALTEFKARCERATDLMPGWGRPELEPVWSSCADGLAAARTDATKILEDVAEPTGFGDLLGIVEGLIDRLEPFAAAEDRFADLRRKGPTEGGRRA